MRDFLVEHLKLWKDSGIPAPANELQSIQGWLRYLGQHGEEETKQAMRNRMILLMQAAQDLYDEGPEAEEAAGIYEHRPEMRVPDDQRHPVSNPQEDTRPAWKRFLYRFGK